MLYAFFAIPCILTLVFAYKYYSEKAIATRLSGLVWVYYNKCKHLEAKEAKEAKYGARTEQEQDS